MTFGFDKFELGPLAMGMKKKEKSYDFFWVDGAVRLVFLFFGVGRKEGRMWVTYVTDLFLCMCVCDETQIACARSSAGGLTLMRRVV